MKERESASEVSEVTSWIHAWVRSHVFHLSMAFSASPPGAEPLTMRQSHVLRLLTPPGSHGGLSTLLSEQLPTQGRSVHREMGADMLVEAPANGGATSNANMATSRDAPSWSLNLLYFSPACVYTSPDTGKPADEIFSSCHPPPTHHHHHSNLDIKRVHKCEAEIEPRWASW